MRCAIKEKKLVLFLWRKDYVKPVNVRAAPFPERIRACKLATEHRTERGDTQFFQLDGSLRLTSHVGLLVRALSPLMSAKCLQSSPFSVLDCLFDLSPHCWEITMGNKFQLDVIELLKFMLKVKCLNFCQIWSELLCQNYSRTWRMVYFIIDRKE